MNKRILAGLLVVTTVMTTVAVNASASYANNSTNVQYIARNQTGYSRQTLIKYLDRINKAIDMGKRGKESIGTLQEWAGYIQDILDGQISGRRERINQIAEDLDRVEQQIYQDLRNFSENRERRRTRQQIDNDIRDFGREREGGRRRTNTND